jgi:hypothetical protein
VLCRCRHLPRSCVNPGSASPMGGRVCLPGANVRVLDAVAGADNHHVFTQQ